MIAVPQPLPEAATTHASANAHLPPLVPPPEHLPDLSFVQSTAAVPQPLPEAATTHASANAHLPPLVPPPEHLPDLSLLVQSTASFAPVATTMTTPIVSPPAETPTHFLATPTH